VVNRKNMQIIDKPWGQEEILETNKFYTVKRLTMNKGCKCSLQYHNKKKETIYVLSGMLSIYFGKKQDGILFLNEKEICTINPKQIHRMRAEMGDVVYLECSTSQLDDVVRIEDDYNRV
jgi:mannose-6-phosphate isomerase